MTPVRSFRCDIHPPIVGEDVQLDVRYSDARRQAVVVELRSLTTRRLMHTHVLDPAELDLPGAVRHHLRPNPVRNLDLPLAGDATAVVRSSVPINLRCTTRGASNGVAMFGPFGRLEVDSRDGVDTAVVIGSQATGLLHLRPGPHDDIRVQGMVQRVVVDDLAGPTATVALHALVGSVDHQCPGGAASACLLWQAQYVPWDDGVIDGLSGSIDLRSPVLASVRERPALIRLDRPGQVLALVRPLENDRALVTVNDRSGGATDSIVLPIVGEAFPLRVVAAGAHSWVRLEADAPVDLHARVAGGGHAQFVGMLRRARALNSASDLSISSAERDARISVVAAERSTTRLGGVAAVVEVTRWRSSRERPKVRLGVDAASVRTSAGMARSVPSAGATPVEASSDDRVQQRAQFFPVAAPSESTDVSRMVRRPASTRRPVRSDPRVPYVRGYRGHYHLTVLARSEAEGDLAVRIRLDTPDLDFRPVPVEDELLQGLFQAGLRVPEFLRREASDRQVHLWQEGDDLSSLVERDGGMSQRLVDDVLDHYASQMELPVEPYAHFAHGFSADVLRTASDVYRAKSSWTAQLWQQNIGAVRPLLLAAGIIGPNDDPMCALLPLREFASRVGPRPVRIGHGDFTLKNMLGRNGRLRSVIDWEFANPFDDPLSDPMILLNRGDGLSPRDADAVRRALEVRLDDLDGPSFPVGGMDLDAELGLLLELEHRKTVAVDGRRMPMVIAEFPDMIDAATDRMVNVLTTLKAATTDEPVDRWAVRATLGAAAAAHRDRGREEPPVTYGHVAVGPTIHRRDLCSMTEARHITASTTPRSI